MAFLLLPLITALIMASTDAQLPLCSAHQACGARISRFPLKEETVGNIVEEIGSGQGSGQEVLSTEPMLYDENVDTVTSFDFDAQPEVEDQYLCRCSEDDSDNAGCDLDSSENIIQVDSALKLNFCLNTLENIKSKCIGRRHFLRVIGGVDKTGETATALTDTIVSCTCDHGYTRVGVEPWTEGYVMTYRCLQ